jgi:hypothetical protein
MQAFLKIYDKFLKYINKIKNRKKADCFGHRLESLCRQVL